MSTTVSTMNNVTVKSFSLPNSVDNTLVLVTSILLVIGLIMIASASVDIADVRNNNPFHYVMRHGVFVILGIIAGFITYQLPSAWWQKMGWLALCCSLVMLLLVIFPGVGKTVNGSTLDINREFKYTAF